MGNPTEPSGKLSIARLAASRAAVPVLVLAVMAAVIGLTWRVFGPSPSIPLPIGPSPGLVSGPIPVTRKANGIIAFECGRSWPWMSDICTVRPDGSGLRTLMSGTKLGDPSWSLAGDRLLYVDGTQTTTCEGASPSPGFNCSDPTGTTIWVADADGINRRQLIDTRGLYDWEPDWSPDGRHVVFSGNSPSSAGGIPSAGPWDLFVANADGTGLSRLTRWAGPEESPDWSPDGLSIVFAAELPTDAAYDLYSLRTSDWALTRLTANGHAENRPEWSPDGSSVAFVRTIETGRGWEPHLVVLRTDWTSEHVLYSCVERCTYINGLAWAPDGTQIVFVLEFIDGEDVQRDLFLVKADGTDPRQLTEGSDVGCCPSWQPLPIGPVSARPM